MLAAVGGIAGDAGGRNRLATAPTSAVALRDWIAAPPPEIVDWSALRRGAFETQNRTKLVKVLSAMVTSPVSDAGRGRLFLGCFMALIATAFGFIIRALIVGDWQSQYGFTETEKGNILGAGLFPFAISIILFSLVIDRVGYGKTMIFAFVCHIVSAYLTITAESYSEFFWATFVFALGNGAVEAVINPVVATVYADRKTHWLNILHAGWPGGLVLGGVLTIAMGTSDTFFNLPGLMWQWKLGLVLIPTLLYGVLLLGVKFPVSERVSAGVSYKVMLREFGVVSCFVVVTMLVLGVAQVLNMRGIAVNPWVLGGAIVALTLLFASQVRAFGQPIFVFLLLIMIPLAITELSTDSWISDLMTNILAETNGDEVPWGAWVLVYTSAIMFVLRFFAGPIVHRISPLGLLCCCAAIAATGLFWLSNATGLAMVFAAATCYGIGKTFFWPTTLGVVAEQFPKGGALTLNSIAGVGMLSAGILGAPLIGLVQDTGLVDGLRRTNPDLVREYVVPKKLWSLLPYDALDLAQAQALRATVKAPVQRVLQQEFDEALATLPAAEQAAYRPLAEAKAALTQGEQALLAQQVVAEQTKKTGNAEEIAAAEAAVKTQEKAVTELRQKERAARTDEAMAAFRNVEALLADRRGKAEYQEEFETAVVAAIPAEEKASYDAAKAEVEAIDKVDRESKQAALAKIAILPCIMFLCYLILVLYFRAKGGYRAEVLTGHAADDEKFTGGVAGPVE